MFLVSKISKATTADVGQECSKGERNEEGVFGEVQKMVWVSLFEAFDVS